MVDIRSKRGALTFIVPYPPILILHLYFFLMQRTAFILSRAKN
jgi:hypothetical protein